VSCVRPARSFRRPALTRIVRCSVGKQIVNVPSFMVRTDSQKHIDFALNSPFGGGRAGRVKRRNQKVRVSHLRTFASLHLPFRTLAPSVSGCAASAALTLHACPALQNASKKEEAGDDAEDEE